MPFDCQSGCCVGNCGSPWCVDPHAVRPRHSGTMDLLVPGHGGWRARHHEVVEVHVHLGWSNHSGGNTCGNDQGGLMLTEIDQALSTLLSTQTYLNERIKVDLEAPTKDWAARRTGPVLNLFLNDIREDTQRRTADIIEVKDEKGIVVARRPAERTFMFSYALSAWTSRPEDDHALLGAALNNLLRQEYLPEDLCQGTLADLARAGRPALVRVGGVLYSERLVTELWTAIGGEFRPVIAVTVSTLIPAGLPTPAGPPQTAPPQFRLTNPETGATSEFQASAPAEESEVAPGQPTPPQRRTRSRTALESPSGTP